MTITMSKRGLDLWTEALESGEYKQGEGYLRKRNPDGEETFCCLGVACEVAIKDGLDLTLDTAEMESEDKDDPTFTAYRYNGRTANLPLEVREYFGMKEYSGAPDVFDPPYVDTYGLSYSILIGWNDSTIEGKTFPEIAAELRAHVVVIDEDNIPDNDDN